jgi:hypothetical protein
VAYWDYGDSTLKYARATTLLGDSPAHWTQIVDVDTANVDGGCSLCIVNGSPAISYRTDAGNDLRYTRAQTVSGQNAGDWVKVTVDSAVHAGNVTVLAIVQGCPAIGYFDDQTNGLHYIRSTSPFGTQAADWGQHAQPSALGDFFASPGLAVVDGRPMMGFYDGTNQVLRWAESATASGAATADWSLGGVADGTGWMGSGASTANVNGQLAIAYRNTEEDGLNYAVYF